MVIANRVLVALVVGLFGAAFSSQGMAQNPQEGDYYVPGPTTPIHLTAGQMKKTQEGDYYAGEKQLLNHKRIAALKMCTDGIKFDSDRYVSCMAKQGEAP